MQITKMSHIEEIFYIFNYPFIINVNHMSQNHKLKAVSDNLKQNHCNAIFIIETLLYCSLFVSFLPFFAQKS